MMGSANQTIGFIAHVDDVRTSVGVNRLGALGAVVAFWTR